MKIYDEIRNIFQQQKYYLLINFKYQVVALLFDL